jgi:hypothetical protein
MKCETEAGHTLTIWTRIVLSGFLRSTECGLGTNFATASMSSILFNFVFARASHTTAYCTSTIQFCVITNTSRYKFCFVEQDIWTVQLKMLALGAWTKKRSKADKTEKNLKDEMPSQVSNMNNDAPWNCIQQPPRTAILELTQCSSLPKNFKLY